jgi:hypothetical protein
MVVNTVSVCTLDVVAKVGEIVVQEVTVDVLWYILVELKDEINKAT